MNTPLLRLTAAATAQLASLQAALDELGLTGNSALALLLATDVARDANEDGSDAQPVLASWQEDAHSSWGDILDEVPTFLTDLPIGVEPDEGEED